MKFKWNLLYVYDTSLLSRGVRGRRSLFLSAKIYGLFTVRWRERHTLTRQYPAHLQGNLLLSLMRPASAV